MRFTFYLLLSSLCCFSAAAHASYYDNDAARQFIAEISRKHPFSANELRGLFRQIERQDNVIKAMSRPAERVLQWKDYRPIFITAKRIAAGVKFWREHRQLLDKVESKYGVPSEIIVAVIGVETFFGRYKGEYVALASLATLAFDYPPRSKFFRGELEQFLLLSKEESLNPLSIKGSYAAALGMPQFIASSYRAYAVDFDGNGQRDLWRSIPDITASVANYFRRHGWRCGEPVAERVWPNSDHYKSLMAQSLKPVISAEQLKAVGIALKQPAKGHKSLHRLMGGKGEELWVGHKNFYVITRYNHSKLYAMAVLQLSQRVAAAMVS